MKLKHFIYAGILVLGCLAVRLMAFPTVHQAALSWTQSNSAGITGNCVYRSQVSGGPYTQLFCSPAPTTTYTDSAVVSGQTYFYVMTAVAGVEESGFSKPEVQAQIPLSPAAPTAPSAVVQ